MAVEPSARAPAPSPERTGQSSQQALHAREKQNAEDTRGCASTKGTAAPVCVHAAPGAAGGHPAIHWHGRCARWMKTERNV